eukprot:5570453-Pyramimonas_sp.AAC.1
MHIQSPARHARSGSPLASSGTAARPSFTARQQVTVFSQTTQEWIPGVVLEVLSAPRVVMGKTLPCGSVLASTSVGKKWVFPAHFSRRSGKMDGCACLRHPPPCS